MRIQLLFAAILCATSLVTAGDSAALSIDIPARSADAFVDSIGVNIHLGYSDTPYREYDTIIKPRLLELGVRHVRDGVVPNRKDVITKLNDLGASGIKSILLIKPADAAVLIPQLKDSILMIEGRNEPDHGEGWEQKVHAEQKALWDAVKNNPATKHIPVVVSAFANTRDSAGKFAAAGSALPYLDYGNTHCYPGGLNPLSGGWGISFDRAIAEVRKVCGDKPVICTESGYHNRLAEKGHPGVPPEVEAKYQPRLLLHYWNKGITRTYLYEFMNLKSDPEFTDKERHFGMLNTDGSPKPEFTALANLIGLLKDPGEPFEPGKLVITLEGYLKNIEYTLLQKRDGRFYFIIWQEVASYDLKGKVREDNAPHTIDFKLTKEAKQLRVFYPTKSAEGKPITNEKLVVHDDILVLEITP